MVPMRSRTVRTAVALGVVLAVLLAGCSDDGGIEEPSGGTTDSGEITRYRDVRPDISPSGYAALGCSLHAELADVDPGDLVNRGDGRQAAFEATWSLLTAAGVWDPEAYGALVEPASALQLVHPQGEWDEVADHRNAVTRECSGVGRTPVGSHVYAAYACHIADQVADTAPNPQDVAAHRLAPTADEIDAVAHLARAAAADGDYGQLDRRAERFHLTRIDEDLREDYRGTLDRLRQACAQLG